MISHVNLTHTPTQVAAGMKAEMKVEIFAMAVGASSGNGVGTVEHLLEITTETSILHLPIQASILSTIMSNYFVRTYNQEYTIYICYICTLDPTQNYVHYFLE